MAEKPVLLDASAVLAWLQNEPGQDVVDPLLPGAQITVVNGSEVLQKVAQAGRNPDEVGSLILGLGVTVIPLAPDDAATIAAWWGKAKNLSIGDRACLAVGQRLRARIVTAEKAWADFPDVDVLVIR